MPELPEVETITRQLERVLVGKKIAKVEVLRQRSFSGTENELIGKRVKSIERRAKMMAIGFENYEYLLIIHLKMTGQLIYLSGNHRVVGGHPTPDWVNELPSKHTRVIIDFENEEKLFFNDLRVFGWMKLISINNWEKITSKLPPDVTSKNFSFEYFQKVVRSSARSVKLVLLDQTKIGGVGNIYANDALYKAKIDPRRKSKDLSDLEIRNLFVAVKEVIERGVKYGGASVDKYVDASGLGGKYQEHFLVYQKMGQRCERDGAEIKKIKVGGRGTFYCPECQK